MEMMTMCEKHQRKWTETPTWIRQVFQCAKLGRLDQTLVDLDPTLIRNLVDSRGNNLLHCSAKSGHLINIQRLLSILGEEAEAALQDENQAGRTVLLTALKVREQKN